MFPFLLCSSSSFRELRFNLPNRLKNSQRIFGLGNLKFSVHGQDACPRLQLTSKYNLPTAGWIKFQGLEIEDEDDKFTFGTREFLVDLFDPASLIAKSSKTTIPTPLILSFDLEVNSGDSVTMPKATRPGDVVFQISCVFSRLGSHTYEKILLSLGNPLEQAVGAQIRRYDTEQKLLMGFRDLVNEKNPNVITGYNIFNFDIPYLMDRANHMTIYPQWAQQGFAKNQPGIAREIKWSSSAYKNQEFKFLDCEGRLYIDLLPVVQRDFKLNDYKLKTVSAHFIGETKDDLEPAGIFKCYREGIKEGELASKYMSLCGKYCIQDSMLVMKLAEKLNVWYSLSEMAVICNVPMITLFTKGQQIKVYSNLYKYCIENQIVPEKDGYLVAENERYVGAFVFAPKPGLYENVVPLDFSSLYPSLIIAYNLDYSTCAFDPSIPDELCHIMEWEDHISCKHDPKVIEKARLTAVIDELTSKTSKQEISDLRKQRSDITKSLNKNVMCEKRRYRFLKVTEENPEFKGVLPVIVQSLLDARKDTRDEMARLKALLKTCPDSSRKELETTISILNQRQLAYKVSANSMYGITGVKAGLLPFMPVAMTITYMGRENILKAAEYGKKKFGGHLIYIDTDSNYFSFPQIQNHQELWNFAVQVANEISDLFPPPMRLEFEDAIYTKFLILTKKRYIYQSSSKDGTVKPELGKRGVVLNRRDNSTFIRNIYENMVKIIFENRYDLKILKEEVISSLIADVNSMFAHQLPIEHFVITKSTGDYGKLEPQYFLNDKGVHRAMIGQYNVPFLTDEIKDAEGITTRQQQMDWYLDKLPAHIQLLEKIRRRGQISNEGSRLEYVIVETNDLKAKQSAKIETLNYFTKNKDILRLDYLYYLHRCINPVDQILEVVFNLRDFMKNHYNSRVAKRKLDLHLVSLFAPKVEVEKESMYLVKRRDVELTKYTLEALPPSSDCECVFRFECLKDIQAFYRFLSVKYGPSSALKTKFIFKDGYVLLGDMSESRLISTIKRETNKN